MFDDLIREIQYNIKELLKRISDANPAPYDETVEYAQFMKWFPLVILLAYITGTYGVTISWHGELNGLSHFLESIFPITRNRFAFLGAIGSISRDAYTATVLAAIFIPLPLVFLHFWGYWSAVLRSKNYKPITILSLINVLQGGLIFAVLFWIVFIGVPASASHGSVGMASIFLWPVFPFISAMLLFLFQGWLFAALMLFLKFSLLIWRRYSHKE